jgi:hypothetical protein
MLRVRSEGCKFRSVKILKVVKLGDKGVTAGQRPAVSFRLHAHVGHSEGAYSFLVGEARRVRVLFFLSECLALGGLELNRGGNHSTSQLRRKAP